MFVEQLHWNLRDGWQVIARSGEVNEPQLVLYFGANNALALEGQFDYLKKRYSTAQLVGCTTAGEIIDEEVYDDTIVATAIQFEKTRVSVSSVLLSSVSNSFQAGAHLASGLKQPELVGVMVISDGTRVNGSELIRGMVSVLGNQIPITGGLAGDGCRFETTLVGCNGRPEPGRVAAIGLYGQNLIIGHGSMGGWDPFGPERKITKAEGNVLYELDGQPALDLYKLYLGEDADQLPGSALLFPLMIRAENNSDIGLVRTVLAVDEQKHSLTFAGDVPEGYYAQLMRANFERLVDGAETAAQYASAKNGHGDKLALLISCVGRKMVLGQRIADEVEAVRQILGKRTLQFGFYAYGGISPHVTLGTCELHNQTMTVTTLSEA